MPSSQVDVRRRYEPDQEIGIIEAVDCFSGRSTDAKRRHREVVTRLEAFDIPVDHVTVVLRESPTEDWGIRGGHAACDIDLGFAVQV